MGRTYKESIVLPRTHPTTETQKAVFALLGSGNLTVDGLALKTRDGQTTDVVEVLDRTRQLTYPYVQIGTMTDSPDHTVTHTMHQIGFEVNIYDRSTEKRDGFEVINLIADEVLHRLDRKRIEIPGMDAGFITYMTASNERDPASDTQSLITLVREITFDIQFLEPFTS